MFSFGIFFTATVILAFLTFMVVHDVIDLDATYMLRNWFAWAIASVMFIISITLVVCSFTFSSFNHLFLTLKHDHVLVCEYTQEEFMKPDMKPAIDPSTIVMKTIQTIHGNNCVTVICAWDDKKGTANIYESLTRDE
jgi:hypothetical protein